MHHLRLIGLAILTAVLPLAASQSASAQRLNYVNQTATSLNVAYFDMPAGTQIFLLDEVSGGTFAPLVPLVTGSGSMAIPLPPGPKQYFVLARQGSTWVAQSVMFYVE